MLIKITKKYPSGPEKFKIFDSLLFFWSELLMLVSAAN